MPITIREENIATGGHYQATGYEIDIDATTGWKTLDISFPFPISLLAAEWNNESSFAGDEANFQVGPETTIGTLSANEASGQTVLSVSQSVIDNCYRGKIINIDDGTNNDNCGRCTDVDDAANTITVETALTNSFLSGDSVKATVDLMPVSVLCGCGRIELGQSKIGGSYIPTNTVLRGRYNNISGTAKKFRFTLEYLY